MNLIIDAGNTQVKLAVYNRNAIADYRTAAMGNFASEVKSVFKQFPNIRYAMVSSVTCLDKTAMNVLSIFCKVFVLDHSFKMPFKNSYASPATLGVDRMALATAAFYHNPNGNTLVIDAGTCVTYDMVNDYGEYLGGAISPGLRMRYKALNQQTANLPLLEPVDMIGFIGNTTDSCIHSGVINGMCQEIDGIITQYRERFSYLTVILTGGDGQFLSKRLKNTIFAHSKFLLEGLNYLLEYNKR
ncbi:type III pantothenate kinase [Zeaxanthinibacter enoshimensis]|uniref:type III pantothenate kinase n=1 Tax=Zeaxanthinibacter enoshimensis TaxID=392009 RepID=UPI00356AFB08